MTKETLDRAIALQNKINKCIHKNNRDFCSTAIDSLDINHLLPEDRTILVNLYNALTENYQTKLQNELDQL